MEHFSKDLSTAYIYAELLVTMYSEDILEFWLDVEFFKRISSEQKLQDTAARIHTTYIVPKAKKEIILNPLIKHGIMKTMKNKDKCEREVFNAAQVAVAEALSARCRVEHVQNIKQSSPSSFTSRIPFMNKSRVPKPLLDKLQKYHQTILREQGTAR